MINAQQIIDSSLDERKNLITNEIENFNNIESEIDKARALSSTINTFIEPYLQIMIEEDGNRDGGSILTRENLSIAFDGKIEEFKPDAIEALRNSFPNRDQLIRSSNNVYEMAGAVRLSFANKVTRTLSTTMGLLWEDLASISPYAVNPESEFNLKVKGIDLISKNINSQVIEYQQLKTQQNTLTGSQKTRSVQELSIHDNPVFCACFPNNKWTFNHATIPRVSGEEFWSRIGIPYDLVLEKVNSLIIELEQEYVSLL